MVCLFFPVALVFWGSPHSQAISDSGAIKASSIYYIISITQLPTPAHTLSTATTTERNGKNHMYTTYVRWPSRPSFITTHSSHCPSPTDWPGAKGPLPSAFNQSTHGLVSLHTYSPSYELTVDNQPWHFWFDLWTLPAEQREPTRKNICMSRFTLFILIITAHSYL